MTATQCRKRAHVQSKSLTGVVRVKHQTKQGKTAKHILSLPKALQPALNNEFNIIVLEF